MPTATVIEPDPVALAFAPAATLARPSDGMKLAFDSRPAPVWHGTGRYPRCLLDALADHAPGAVVESRDPRRGDVFHSPWLDGAPLRSPVPTVVTLHDLIPLKHPGDYMRTGLRFKLRYLAVQRATRVIVPTRTVADDAIRALDIPAERIEVIPQAAAPAFWKRPPEEVAAVRERYELPDRYLLWVGTMRRPDPRKRVAALARAERSMPLVLVGPLSRWARELRGVLRRTRDPLGRRRPRRPRPPRRGAVAPGGGPGAVDLGRRRRRHVGGV